MILVTLITCFQQNALAAETKRVLFLGNSYTYVNNLPKLISDVASSAGDSLQFDSNTLGGCTLLQHSTNETSLNKISAEHQWDYVILQEQSQMPVIPFYRDNWTYPAAALLDSIITSHNSNTLLFMTWGRKFGGIQTIDGHSSPAFKDFQQMQDSLSTAYTRLALQLNSKIAPVGDAWKLALSQNQNMNFWSSDNSHPSIYGSYLAACIFYSIIFEKSPLGLYVPDEITDSEAGFLQQASVTTLQGSSIEQETNLQHQSTLYQNFPNPFNPTTTITYELHGNLDVNVVVYNIKGEHIWETGNLKQKVGKHSIQFDGSEFNSGIYSYSLNVGGVIKQTKRMILIK